jgi:hypothetical protein
LCFRLLFSMQPQNTPNLGAQVKPAPELVQH